MIGRPLRGTSGRFDQVRGSMLLVASATDTSCMRANEPTNAGISCLGLALLVAAIAVIAYFTFWLVIMELVGFA
jgi:hypothetical protein